MTIDTLLYPTLLSQWREARSLTHDYLDMLTPAQLELRLPFPESQTLGYQFWCMLGAQESFLRVLEHGEWQGFASSLDQFDEVTPERIRKQMNTADEELERIVETLDPVATLKNGQPAYDMLFRMIKHEMHHHGQLINFMFCHRLPIPASWQDEWALSYD